MQNEIARIRATLAQGGAGSSDFDLNPDLPAPQGRILRPAAVLVPLWVQNGTARLILTKRASHLKHHAGQIAFPGGKVEATDNSPAAAALREAWEEIGLGPETVDIIGQLPAHETVTAFQVTPVLGLVTGRFSPNPHAGEVAEVFTVPLAHILAPDAYQIEQRIWQGHQRRFYTLPYGPYYIWGATARILRGLADRVARCS